MDSDGQIETDYWQGVLTGQDEALIKGQRILRKLPSAPRCKLCMAPFQGPYSLLLKSLGFRRWDLNQQLCRRCFHRVDSHQGGAEIPVSLLYVDIRGSTTLAESMTPSDYSAALNAFYKIVADAVDTGHGVVDHMAGDGVMAMWIPAFVGEDHPGRAADAGHRIAREMADGQLPAGVGIHTGNTFVGVVGEGAAKSFTSLGDTTNTVARLSSAADGGEAIYSEQVARDAGLDTSDLEHRMLDLKGKADPFPVWVEHLSGGAK